MKIRNPFKRKDDCRYQAYPLLGKVFFCPLCGIQSEYVELCLKDDLAIVHHCHCSTTAAIILKEMVANV